MHTDNPEALGSDFAHHPAWAQQAAVWGMILTAMLRWDKASLLKENAIK